MQLKEFGVSLGDLIHEFNFEVVYGPEGFEKTEITKDDVNRPGLQLAGFFDYFDPNRIQIMGKVESSYVEGLSSEERRSRFDRLFETGIPVLLLSRNIDVFPECLAAAQEHGVPILRTNEFTSTIMSAIIASLKVNLAPRVTLHGVLIEIYGEGVLLLGDSGVGKSETAIELVKRGHRLIADDAVEIKRVSDKTLVGTAPEVIRHFIELRGIGIVDVRRIFGVGAIKMTEKVELVINLEPWEDGKQYDRLGMDSQTTSILDLAVPSLTIPVKPGRNLAFIIEVAAMNDRQKKMGFNAAKELQERMLKQYGNCYNVNKAVQFKRYCLENLIKGGDLYEKSSGIGMYGVRSSFGMQRCRWGKGVADGGFLRAGGCVRAGEDRLDGGQHRRKQR